MAKYIDLIIRAKGDTKGVEDATNAINKLEKKAGEASVSVNDALSATHGSLSSVLKIAMSLIPGFKSIGAAAMAAIGGITAGFGVIFTVFKSICDQSDEIEERMRQVKDSKLDEYIESAAKAQKDLADATERASKALDKQAAAAQKLSDAAHRINQANIEAARARDLAAAAPGDRDAINERYDAMLKADSSVAQREQIAKRIERMEWDKHLAKQSGDDLGWTISTLKRQLDGMDGASDEKYQEVEKKIKEAQEKQQAFYRKSRELSRDIEAATDEYAVLDAEDAANVEKEIAQKILKEREAAEKIAEDKARSEAEAARKAVEDERRAREQMEAELHRQRITDMKAEIAAAAKEKSSIASTAASAQSEFDKAFGMYRNSGLAVSTIAEERAYAADYKRLGKDAARYGGKWRIDELAGLMAAGDTQGQAAKLEEWRKSSGFTPEVEAMVRASAADQTRTTAEAELRKISANTEGLAKKLDELLQVK